MEKGSRAWLEQLDQAAQRALETIRALDDPSQESLIKDLEAFRERLAARLAAS